MAKPRIFISSTFFDLRQVRADLERFILEIGYESVRNETGSIPYGKDLPLEDYCYKEISGIDILVGLIGGRFGSTSSHGDYSITQAEIRTALEQNKNVYIFIQKNVHSEYQTYLINKENNTTKYKYADDIRIYKFIEEIYSLPKNNTIQSFETAQDIIHFLREQWAGLFRDLLNENNQKLANETIAKQVNELSAISSTLKTYMENVLQNVNEDSTTLIEEETKKLKRYKNNQEVLGLRYFEHLRNTHNLKTENIIASLNDSNSLTEFHDTLKETRRSTNLDCVFADHNLEQIQNAREIIGSPKFTLSDEEKKRVEEESGYRDGMAKMFMEKLLESQNQGNGIQMDLPEPTKESTLPKSKKKKSKKKK